MKASPPTKHWQLELLLCFCTLHQFGSWPSSLHICAIFLSRIISRDSFATNHFKHTCAGNKCATKILTPGITAPFFCVHAFGRQPSYSTIEFSFFVFFCFVCQSGSWPSLLALCNNFIFRIMRDQPPPPSFLHVKHVFKGGLNYFLMCCWLLMRWWWTWIWLLLITISVKVFRCYAQLFSLLKLSICTKGLQLAYSCYLKEVGFLYFAWPIRHQCVEEWISRQGKTSWLEKRPIDNVLPLHSPRQVIGKSSFTLLKHKSLSHFKG